jgi:hypothetical protein
MTPTEVHAIVHGVFTHPGRVLDIQITDFGASIVLRCDHVGAVKLTELIDLAVQLEVLPAAIELWDVAPNRIEVRIDLDPVTPPARPSLMPSF